MATDPALLSTNRLTLLARGFAVQHRVIAALMLRELHTRYGRDNIGYVWILVEPLLLAVAVALIHAAVPGHLAPGIHPVPFAIAGYTMFILFRGIFTRAEGALESNAPLLYHQRVTLFDILLSRALLELIGTAVVWIVLIGGTILAGWADLPERPLYVFLSFFFMFLFAFGASMTVCAFAHQSRVVARLVHPFTYILMPLSGAFFALAWFSPSAREAFMISPMVQIFEMMRYGLFEYAKGDYFNSLYIAVWCMGLCLIGMVSLIHARTHIELH